MNPYGNLKDKEPDSRGRRGSVRYASDMEKKRKCKCRKENLPPERDDGIGTETHGWPDWFCALLVASPFLVVPALAVLARASGF